MLFTDWGFFPMPEIETDRLLLRRLRMADAPDMYAYSRDPEVARYVLWDAHQSPSETKAYIRYMMRKYRAGDPASWGIELKETGRIIGTIGYMWYEETHRSTEVGYSLSRDYWNRGIMTEALRAVLRYSFSDLHMHRVEAQHEEENPASGVVMQKAGMRYEGTLRGRLRNKGKYVNVRLYAILREDTAW